MIQTTIEPSTTASTTATEMPRRLRRATQALRSSRKAPSLTKKAPKAKPAPVDSALACEIILAARAAGVLVKEFGKNPQRQSAVVKLPTWSDFQAKLPTGDEGTVLAQTFHALRDAIQTLVGDAASTWVIHMSGSFAIYSKFTR